MGSLRANPSRAAAVAAEDPLTRIRAPTGWTVPDLAELWRYRELVYFLIWRDLKVRYKQTLLGAAWAILQPLATMVVFSVFFGRLAKIPSEGLPYPLFAYAALVPWSFFASGLGRSTTSLVGSQNLITKVYFPRLVIPLAAVLSGLVDFALAFVVLIGLMIAYAAVPGPAALMIVPLLALALVTCLGVGLWLSALNVKYRDVGHAVPLLIQLWLFATPIAYPSSLLAEPWRTLYAINPMVGVVEGFRWALLGAEVVHPGMFVVSALVALALLASGVLGFLRMERDFADVV